jgi:hypothetical protein
MNGIPVTNVSTEELLDWKITERGRTVETGKIKDANTFMDSGKTNLAKLVGGTDDKFIDSMWGRMSDGTWLYAQVLNTATDNKNTLAIDMNPGYTAQWTIPGTYSAVMVGSYFVAGGSLSPYGSIGTTIVLLPDQEISFQVRYVFSGLNGLHGNDICAARFGNITSIYNSPLSSIAIYDVGDGLIGSFSLTNSVTNNTLICDMGTNWVSGSYVKEARYRVATLNYIDGEFEKTSNMAINVSVGSSLNFFGKFIFN